MHGSIQGEQAPDFALLAADGQRTALRDLRGSPVVLAFYPADWSPVCSDQMALYNEVLEDFERLGARIFGISVDSRWCHRAFADSRNLRFQLLADFEPKGAVARQYGVYRELDGTTERALVVIDADGMIRWHYVAPIEVNPGAEGILEALEALAAEASK